MKKILSVVLALTMIATLGLTAFALPSETVIDKSNNPAPAGTDVIVKVDKDSIANATWYSVKIPADKTIAWGTPSVNMNYSVACQLDTGKTLKIKVAGTAVDATTNKMTATGVTDVLKYTYTGFAEQTFDAVTGSRTLNDDNTTYTYTYEAPETAVVMNFASWDGIAVAEYADTLTYTVAVA